MFKFLLVVPILVFAVLIAPNPAMSYSVNDTFTDIAGQPDFNGENRNPGDITLVDEHGLDWGNDDSVLLTIIWSWGGSATIGRLAVKNTSSHMMADTVVAFEDVGPISWKTQTLASWDGTDSSGSAAYWFGDIAAGAESYRYLDLVSGHLNWTPAYNSQGLDSGDYEVSNISVTHAIVPEPISSILFLTGGATLGLRRFRKKV